MNDFDDIIESALADAGVMEKEAELNLDDEDLSSITKLSAEMMRLEDLVAKLDSVLKEAAENLRTVRENHLPDAMMNAELKSIELSDGSKLSYSLKYIGNIKKDNEEAAIEWFKTTSRVGVVTPSLTIPVSKGRLDEAEGIAERLKELGIEVMLRPTVHWQTLRAVVRELYENGEEIPECISTYTINEAKIKRK